MGRRCRGGEEVVGRIKLIFALITMIIGLASFPAAAQSGRTFYIDYASGSNSNSGTSNSSPWKSHPYMQTSTGCTGSGSAPSYAHQAGDRFIFKGGVSWPAACFSMNVAAGGTTSAQDYYGVDQSWFTGSSFARPRFDCNFIVPTGNVLISSTATNIIFDNLEIVHQGINANGVFGTQAAFQFNAGGTGVIIENSLIHDWVATNTISTNTINYSAGSVYGPLTLSNTEINDVNGYFGSGHTAVSFGGACQNCAEVKNSHIHHTMAACFTVYSCHDSEFDHITSAIQAYDSDIHTQVIENDYGQGVEKIYNNLIHDNIPVGVTVYTCAQTNFYNNVMWNNGNKEILLGGCSNNSASSVANIYNNTVDCSNTSCFGTDSKATLAGTVNLENNHWITNGSPISNASAIATFNQNNNITMSTSVATSQGYTSVNLYAPTSSSGGTVHVALNLSGRCSGSLGSLCSDRLHVPRLTSWDAGAYLFDAQAAGTKPNPPANLNAVVQ